MSDEHEELLAALGQLQSIVKSSIERKTRRASEAAGVQAMLEAVLASAQRAGLTPAQTAELMRGLGIVRGPDDAGEGLAPLSQPPQSASREEPATLDGLSLLPEWSGDLGALAAPEVAPGPQAAPPPVHDDEPEERPSRGRHTIRRVSRPARLAPSARGQGEPEPQPSTHEPSRSTGRKAETPTLPPLPRRTAPATPTDERPSAVRRLPVAAAEEQRPSGRKLRKVGEPAPAIQPTPSTPPGAGPTVVVSRSVPPASLSDPLAELEAYLAEESALDRPRAPASERRTPPAAADVRRTAPVEDDPLAELEAAIAEEVEARRRAALPAAPPEPQRAPSDARLIDEAALALAGSMAGIEDQLRNTNRRRAPFDPSTSSSSVTSMLEVEIDQAPAFNGNWIWNDADIRSPLKRSLPALLAKYAREKASVRLELTVGRARAEFELREGHLISARTNLKGSQLGDLIVGRNRIPPGEQASGRALRTPRDAAAWIARTEAIDASQLHEAIVATTRENLAHCLRWPGGQFRVFKRRDGGSKGLPRLSVLASLLSAIDAIPAQIALMLRERFAQVALLPGEHHARARSLKRDSGCAVLLTRRPQPEPLKAALARLGAPHLDATRRVVLLVEIEALTFGDELEKVGAHEVRREAKTPVPGFNCRPLAQQFAIDEATAEALVIATLQACLVQVTNIEAPTVNDLIALARLAISRDARPAANPEADRHLVSTFNQAGLSVPAVSDFCEVLIDLLAEQGLDLHRLVPRQSMIGALLYTND